METSNQPLEKWREILEKILQYYADIPYRYGDVSTYLVVSRDRNHFLLMHEGWENERRVHGCLVHAEIRNDKIWVHYDGIEDGITCEMVAAGVPKNHIVLGFHSPEVREYTGYALA
jgi:XisI protein